LLPKKLVSFVQSLAFIFEHMPVVKETCGTLCIRAKRPDSGLQAPRRANLASYPQFRNAVSFVIPCHNEEPNIGPLVKNLTGLYDAYIREIVIVNDNSSDRTVEVTRQLALHDARVKLVDRTPPNGLGRALKDGFAAATGPYIFTMDADFIQILPECRDLFDALAQGYDGAIGSRFTQESVMVNYPFIKILCNRGFHLLANLLLRCHVHDISNNLKLFRAEIFKQMDIAQPHFAANAEIGLKAVLAGYSIREVPVSWINRTSEMGQSSFRIVRVAPGYFSALMRIARSARRGATASAKPPDAYDLAKDAPAADR